MSEMFDTPGSANAIQWKDLNGALLLFTVTGQEFDMPTKFTKPGEKGADPVRVDLIVLDGPQSGETYEDTLVFPRGLIGQLKSKVGSRVLGRLGQGQAKAGQDPPWLLTAATPEDEKVARAALSGATTSAGKDTPPY